MLVQRVGQQIGQTGHVERAGGQRVGQVGAHLGRREQLAQQSSVGDAAVAGRRRTRRQVSRDQIGHVVATAIHQQHFIGLERLLGRQGLELLHHRERRGVGRHPARRVDARPAHGVTGAAGGVRIEDDRGGRGGRIARTEVGRADRIGHQFGPDRIALHRELDAEGAAVGQAVARHLDRRHRGTAAAAGGQHECSHEGRHDTGTLEHGISRR